MKRLDNKGMTLVEMILSILILGIASVMLVESFVSSMKIVNRATLYKNASSAVSSSIELDSEQTSKDAAVKTKITHTSAQSNPVKLTINGGSSVEVKGEYIECADIGGSTKLKYHEYLPSNYSYDIPANPTNGSED